MQVERPLRKKISSNFPCFLCFLFLCLLYTWTLTTAPGIPSPFIQDETGDKVGASKDVKEDDSGSSEEAESSQNGHALNKKKLNTELLILNIICIEQLGIAFEEKVLK